MMIEVRIIQYSDIPRHTDMGVKEVEAIIASMMNDGWEIKSYQYDSQIDDNHGGGVFVMVRDVEPVVEAVDDELQTNLEILFDILSKKSTVGALRPGLLWQVQYALVAVAKWLLAHDVPDTSVLGREAKDYIKDIEARARAGTLQNYAKDIYAMYQKTQKDGEQ